MEGSRPVRIWGMCIDVPWEGKIERERERERDKHTCHIRQLHVPGGERRALAERSALTERRATERGMHARDDHLDQIDDQT